MTSFALLCQARQKRRGRWTYRWSGRATNRRGASRPCGVCCARSSAAIPKDAVVLLTGDEETDQQRVAFADRIVVMGNSKTVEFVMPWLTENLAYDR